MSNQTLPWYVFCTGFLWSITMIIWNLTTVCSPIGAMIFLVLTLFIISSMTSLQQSGSEIQPQEKLIIPKELCQCCNTGHALPSRLIQCHAESRLQQGIGPQRFPVPALSLWVIGETFRFSSQLIPQCPEIKVCNVFSNMSYYLDMVASKNIDNRLYCFGFLWCLSDE